MDFETWWKTKGRHLRGGVCEGMAREAYNAAMQEKETPYPTGERQKMNKFWSAVVCTAKDKIVAKRTDNGKTYTIPKGKYLVHATDGRWRVTNTVPAIWLSLTPEQELLAEPTGDHTNDERDWWDTN